VDNYATHKHPKVQVWSQRHRRSHFHFVPALSSRLNLLERWFRELTDKRTRSGVFKSLADFITAIQTYIEHHNSNPKPFVWTAKAKRYHRQKIVELRPSWIKYKQREILH
jgi:hypothetical protein